MRRIAAGMVAAALAMGATAVAGSPAASAPEAEPASVPGELLVGYREGSSPAERARARGRADAVLADRVVAPGAGRGAVELVRLPRGLGRGEAIARLGADPAVAYAEPNWVVTVDATSNDPYVTNGSLWGMYGDESSPANPYGSQAAEAWAADATGSPTVYVGIIDEGYQTTHPDLAANVGTVPGEIGGNGIDDDGNGYVDDVHGWDFDRNDNTVYDGPQDDHGTHVAGTIGGKGGNGIGVAGVAWDVRLISAKFLGRRGGTTANAVKAVDYITDLKTRHGLNIVATNNSWGGGGYSQTLFEAIERANEANILFIAAAGNGGSDGVGDNNDTSPQYPASYTNANIISVASITSTGARSGFSNYGATSVDLGAPGSGIVSTLPDGYGSYSGTSMATPHVTGAAVLYAAEHLGASAAQIKAAILGSAAPTPSLAGRTVTGGRLDVHTMLGVDAGGGTVEPGPNPPPPEEPGPAGTMTAQYTGTSAPSGKRGWKATVTATVVNAVSQPVSGAAVTGTWSYGSTGSCTTDGSGTCTITSSTLKNFVASVDFAPVSVTATGYEPIEGGATLSVAAP